MVEQTSLNAWYKIEESLRFRQKEVFDSIMRLQPCSSLDVAEWLHRPLHTISGRFSELQTMGLIKSYGDKYHGNRKFKTWKVI